MNSYDSVSLVTAVNKAFMNSYDTVIQCFLGYHCKQSSAALMNSYDSVSLVTAVNKAFMNSYDTVFPWLPL